MSLTVCLSSFYLSFVMVFLMTIVLDAVAYRYYYDKYKSYFVIKLLFYLVIVLSLPLLMILFSQSCAV